MIKKMTLKLLLAVSLLTSAHAAGPKDGWELFDMMTETLKGEWKLSSAEKQKGAESYKHPAVLPLAGTDKTGMAYRLIGRDTTLQEDLLTDTDKEMVTMYHCKDIACTTLKATHYCAKQNQPEFIADLKKSSKTRFVFDCDMSTELCNSKENHVHKIVLTLSEEGKHLKASYLSWAGGEPIGRGGSSIYHFDRK